MNQVHGDRATGAGAAVRAGTQGPLGERGEGGGRKEEEEEVGGRKKQDLHQG